MVGRYPKAQCRAGFWASLLLAVWIGHLLPSSAAVLSYSTYYGGPGYDGFFDVAVDQQGNAFVAGGTTSTNSFPILNALQSGYGGGFSDGTFAKFDPNGRLLFASYFGGNSEDYINALALDPDGNLLIVGQTHSTDLPTTDDAFQPDYGGGTAIGLGDGFIARISADGSKLLYCSYFGGSGDENINGLAIDASGNVCLTGQTDSTDLPLKNPLQSQFGGGDTDGFVAKFDHTLTNLIFSTYFGGSNRDEEQKIAVDPAGFIYLAGQTFSTNFPVSPNAFQTNHEVVPKIGDNWDAFAAKLSPDGSHLVYSTYIGSATEDSALAVKADAQGAAYLTGVISAAWPDGTFPLGFQPTPGYGLADGWVGKLKPDGSNFEWFSYLGGSGSDWGNGLALDGEGNVFVTGITRSLDFPVVDAPQPKYGGGTQNAWVAKVSADGKQLLYSTYLGGSGEEWGYSLAVDPLGNAIAVGQSSSIDFPVRQPWQSTNASLPFLSNPADAYVVKLSPQAQAPRLSLTRSGATLLIAWPTNFPAFVLEAAPSPVGANTNWSPVSNPPLVLGNQNTSVQPNEGLRRFFRLRRPAQ